MNDGDDYDFSSLTARYQPGYQPSFYFLVKTYIDETI